MGEGKTESSISFWEHLDILRACLFRISLVTSIFGVAAFLFKEELFTVILAPKDNHFITYRILGFINNLTAGNESTDFTIQLINTGLAEQFVIHMRTAIYAGFLLSSPYTLYLLFHFISPALYLKERKYAASVVSSGYVMFILGLLLSYFLIFPLTFRFLGTYQVRGDVLNMISLQSYMDTLMTMSFMMGIVFELPVLCWLFAKLGFISADFMYRYRKHAIVVILIIAAIITPTSDVFTMSLVACPVYLLYEVSILIVKRMKLYAE